MKVSSVATLLLSAAFASNADAGDYVCVTADGVDKGMYMPIQADSMDTIEDYYGYSRRSDEFDNWSANTPGNIEGQNSDDSAILAVAVEGGLSIAYILDQPQDGNGGNVNVTISCEGPGCHADYPETGWFAVADDRGDLRNRFQVVGGKSLIRQDWNRCCTDGAATQPMTGNFKVCITICPITWPGDDHMGIFFWDGPTMRTMVDGHPADGSCSKEICIDSDCHGGDVFADPHFELWNHQMYDYMGECDMAFIQAKNFATNQDLLINIRTSIRYDYSFVSNAALKLGDDIFEVASFGEYVLNGVNNADLSKGATVGGFPLIHKPISKKEHVFEILLEDHNEKIVMRVFKDLVAVKLDQVSKHRLEGSTGMLGDFKTGQMLGRDGTTVYSIDDANDFAADWQVKEGEEMLFQSPRAPQHPAQCVLPTPGSAEKRRLGETKISRDVAEKACASWDAHFFSSCVHDVMATGDLDLAASGPF